jgi:recombination protein RecR
MRILPRSIEKLIEAFEKLPGIGPKSASRLTFYLLHVPQGELDHLGDAVKDLKRNTVYCSKCFNIGESDPCVICASIDRDEGTVCVVEHPINILSIEKTGKYKGVYHVLHGVIDPLSNIGPDEIRIDGLLARIRNGKITEVILATNPTMEGEATAMYIRREIINLKSKNANINGVRMTRLAHGLPVGGDLDYADELTLSRSLEGRNDY